MCPTETPHVYLCPVTIQDVQDHNVSSYALRDERRGSSDLGERACQSFVRAAFSGEVAHLFSQKKNAALRNFDMLVLRAQMSYGVHLEGQRSSRYGLEHLV